MGRKKNRTTLDVLVEYRHLRFPPIGSLDNAGR